jgi:hypothetical protein
MKFICFGYKLKDEKEIPLVTNNFEFVETAKEAVVKGYEGPHLIRFITSTEIDLSSNDEKEYYFYS